MFIKKITYEDFNGIERTEELCFNLTKTELTQMNLDKNGTLPERLQRIIDSKDIAVIAKEFKDIIIKSYGIKSEDGRHFKKSDEISSDFVDSAAYDKFIMSILEDPDLATEFVMNVIPKDLAEKVKETPDYKKAIQ